MPPSGGYGMHNTSHKKSGTFVNNTFYHQDQYFPNDFLGGSLTLEDFQHTSNFSTGAPGVPFYPPLPFGGVNL